MLKASTATLSLGPYCDRANFVVMLVIKVTIPSFPKHIDVTVFRERAFTTLKKISKLRSKSKEKKVKFIDTFFVMQQQENQNKNPLNNCHFAVKIAEKYILFSSTS